jgi:hypothetical protein
MVYMNVHSNQKSNVTALLYANSNFDGLKGRALTPLYYTIKPSHFVPVMVYAARKLTVLEWHAN